MVASRKEKMCLYGRFVDGKCVLFGSSFFFSLDLSLGRVSRLIILGPEMSPSRLATGQQASYLAVAR